MVVGKYTPPLFNSTLLLALRDSLPENDQEEAVETKHAKELNLLLGSKFPPQTHSHPSRTDLIIDLHTSTANVGATLTIPEDDTVAVYAVRFYDQSHGTTKEDETIHNGHDRNSRPNISSVAKHGWTVEVGPVPTSSVRDDANRQTRRIIELLLECLELWNTREEGYLRSCLVGCL